MDKHLFLTARPGKTYSSAEEIKYDWHDGKEFRVYGGHMISNSRKVEMLIKGVTHIEVVYQNPAHDMKAESVIIAL